MNVLTAVVTGIKTNPHKITISRRDYWAIDVEHDCYGRVSDKRLLFDTEEEADSVEIGYEFET